MTDDEVIQLRLKATADLLLMIKEAQDSPLGLYKLMVRSKDGGPPTIKPFHHEWNDLILHNRRVLIEASRGLGKTTFLIAVVAWMIGKNPNIRVKWIGPSDDNAAKRLSVIHEWIDKEDSPYHLVFPNVKKTSRSNSKRPNNAGQLNLVRDIDTPEPTIEAVGVVSSGTGGRDDLLILDDVADQKNTILNPSMMPKVTTKVLSDWLPTLVGDGQAICIFTPWHSGDVNAHLKKTRGWAYAKHAHGTDDDPYFSIFPEMWPRSELIDRRRDLGEHLYNLAYRCLLSGGKLSLVLPEHLTTYSRSILTPEVIAAAKVLLSVDPASGKESAGELDFVGISVILYYQWTVVSQAKYRIYIPEAFQVKLPILPQAKLIWQLAKLWQPNWIIVESKGMQSLDMWLRDQQARDPALAQYQVLSNTFGSTSKAVRLQAITPLLSRPTGEEPVVFFHPKVIARSPQPDVVTVDGEAFEILRDLRDQLLSFPTKKDDILDSLTQGLGWVQRTILPIGGKTEEDKPKLSCKVVSFGGRGRR